MATPDVNPYASPATTTVAAPSEGGRAEAERIRRDHIGKEAGIKGVGTLMLLGGLVNAAFGIRFTTMWGPAVINGTSGLLAGLIISALLCAVLQLFGGIQLRRLRALGRVLVSLAVVVSLVAGLAIAGPDAMGMAALRSLVPILIVSTLWTAKADMVFSVRYRAEIIPATRHITYRTPRWIWILLAVAVGLIGIVVLFALASRPG